MSSGRPDNYGIRDGGMTGSDNQESYGGQMNWPRQQNMGSAGDAGGYYGSQSQEDYSGRGPKGYRRADERIQEDINEQFTRHPRLDASEIEVRVENGEVTLSGSVSDRNSKRLAEDIAESCSGVNNVQNQLRVNREGQHYEREVPRRVENERSHRASSSHTSGSTSNTNATSGTQPSASASGSSSNTGSTNAGSTNSGTSRESRT
jgi:hypothetical protein